MKEWRHLATLVALATALARTAGADTPQAGASASEANTRESTAEELAALRELWSAGLELEKSKQWAAALEKFEKVARVKMTPQVRYHIALCHEQLGRLVDAFNGYQLAVQDARALGDKARDVTENAPPRIEQLRGRVGKLRIRVVGKIRTSVITIDNKPISLALLDSDIPVDPQQHVVEARRDGKRIAGEAVELAEGGSAVVELAIDDPQPAAPIKPALPTPPAPSRIPAYVTAGAGAAMLIGSGVFFGLRQATISNIRATCDANDANCDPTLAETEGLGRAYTTASGVLLGVGAAALATGVVLWFVLAPPKAAAKPGEPTRAFYHPAAGVTLGGVKISARF